jgi:flagellar motility protein MotE (MotC chaperone)
VGELATLLAGSGVFGVLAIIIVYLLAAVDKAQRRADEGIAKAEQRADDWAARHRETQRLLDESRDARRAAEDRADEQAREIRDLRDEVKDLRAEVQDLRTRLGTGGPA